MSKNKVFDPLKADHPLVVDKIVCPLCKKYFYEHERVTLLSADSDYISTVQAVAVHARCGLRGVKTAHGEIRDIKDGDGSPFPVIMTDGKQYKPKELGLD